MVRLTKLGGSLAVTIPSGILKEARIKEDTDVEIEARDGEVVIRRGRPRRTLQQILAECDPAAPASVALRLFDADPAVGDELV